MGERIFCVNCFKEIDTKIKKCPFCKEDVSKSLHVWNYLSHYHKNRENPSVDSLHRRFGFSAREVSKIIKKFNEEIEKRKESRQLNTIISKLKVVSLFDYLDYDIDLNEKTSIILAPNGFGKTTIFNLIDFVLKPSMAVYDKYIKEVPFKIFELTLKNGAKISLEHLSDDDEGEFANYSFKVKGVNIADEGHLMFAFDDKESLQKRHAYSMYSAEEANARNRKLQASYESIDMMQAILKECEIYSDIFFIRTNRAFVDQEPFTSSALLPTPSDEAERPEPIVSCNADLERQMDACRTLYLKSSEEAKNTLPLEFLNSDSNDCSIDSVRIKLKEYKETIKKLADYGLIESGEGLASIDQLDADSLEVNDPTKKRFISLYLDKFSETLEPFLELYFKMEMFLDVMGERYNGTRKEIKFTNHGVEFYNNDKKIGLDCLSSGEKNDFIMFYDLIFRVKNGSIVLIDEPEISLHINWQEKFIDNIEKAMTGKDGQIVVCTHSPDIISTHNDCITSINFENGQEYND